MNYKNKPTHLENVYTPSGILLELISTPSTEMNFGIIGAAAVLILLKRILLQIQTVKHNVNR